jgi:hypothetical protein
MQNKMLEFNEVSNGSWSLAGNVLGKCENGNIIHIYKRQMEYLGYQHIITDSERFTNNVEFPIFILAYNKEFVNANGQNVTRLTAASIFNSYKKLIDALVADINLDTAMNNVNQ